MLGGVDLHAQADPGPLLHKIQNLFNQLSPCVKGRLDLKNSKVSTVWVVHKTYFANSCECWFNILIGLLKRHVNTIIVTYPSH